MNNQMSAVGRFSALCLPFDTSLFLCMNRSLLYHKKNETEIIQYKLHRHSITKKN